MMSVRDHGLTFILAGLGLSAGLAGAAAWAAAARAPRFEVSSEIDVGELEFNREIEIGVGWQNSGTAVLRLEPPRSGCSCAQPVLDRLECSPGERGMMRIRLLPVRPAGSKFEQSVHVRSNDPRQQERTILLKGRMQKKLIAVPNVVRRIDGRVLETLADEVRIRVSGADTPFGITETTSNISGLRISEPIPMNPEGSEHALFLEYSPESVGDVRGVVIVTTSHPQYSRVEIPVEITIPSQLETTPPTLLFEAADAGREQVVTIRAPKPVELHVPPPLDQNSPLAVTVTRDGAGELWTMAVTLTHDVAEASPTKADIELQVVGLAGEPKARIPVVIVPAVQPPGDEGQ